jgi:uncharacterized membrane protein (UPF0127 family)
MKLFPIKIDNNEFNVAVADTLELQKKGLSGLERLGKRKGMLFIFGQSRPVNMVMTDMNFGLDFVFLDQDWKIVQLASLTKDNANSIASYIPVNMVLELPEGIISELNITLDSKVEPNEELITQFQGVKQFKSGGLFELVGEKIYKVKISDVKPEEGKLQILNENGEVAANIQTDCRIFSRKDTKNLIDTYKTGDKIQLAKLMVKILDEQDSRKPEYVTK